MFSDNQLKAIHNSKIGFEFEFFSNFDLTKTKDGLSRALGKKIRIEEKAHSDFSPTQDTFKLEPDNSGGTGMIELVTGSTPFVEAKLILAKGLKWIRENGNTNERCSIHVNISFDGKKIGVPLNISNLDVGKFVLSFDENKVYEAFPNRRDSVYAKSIKYVTPVSDMSLDNSGKNVWTNYKFVSEKYYGVNFTKTVKGYLEFRYLGGKDYEKKYSPILSMIEHFVVSLYEALTDPTYTKENLLELDKILLENSKIVNSYRSYKVFQENFPDIKIIVDLKSNSNIIEMYYPKLRASVMKLITEAGLKQGYINYDSDYSRLQIKDADLSKCFLVEGVDLVECKINGNIKSCDIFDCVIDNSSIHNSNLFGYTKLNDSKIEDSYVSRNVEVNGSYVFGKNGIFSGVMNGGIFRQGRATDHAQFKDTEIIEVEKIK